MSIFDSQVSKREIIETQIEHTRLSFLDRQSSDQNFSSRGNDRKSSEQNNRKLISLHNNGEDENLHTDLQISSCWEHIST
jgi:hypothetical protein